jgi:aminomethyltransferase
LSEEELLKSPMAALEAEQGARFVAFGGWSLPVAYRGILEEYRDVRENAGYFDVSHMGRFIFKGSDAADCLDRLIANSIADLAPGHGRYGLMCRDDGGILDDVICFRRAEHEYLLVVNGATREKDRGWVNQQATGFPKVEIQDMTLETAMVALQGPRALEVLRETFEALNFNPRLAERVEKLDRFRIEEVQPAAPLPLLLSTTGYTGEAGVELLGPIDIIQSLWKEFGRQGAGPAGLGARDILRLEMGYLLYGQDATEEYNPYEARLGWTVKLKKPADFIGKEALEQIREKGPARQLVGLVLEGKRLPRTGMEIYREGRPAGKITSGGHSPRLGKPIALGYVENFSGQWGQKVEVDIRSSRTEAVITRPPFLENTSL